MDSRLNGQRGAWAVGCGVLVLWFAIVIGGAEIVSPDGSIWQAWPVWAVFAGGAAIILTMAGLAALRRASFQWRQRDHEHQ